jgi:membrane protein
MENRLTGLAAEVTYFAVLSLFPGLLIVASALGYLETIVGHDLAERSQGAVIEFLQKVLTERGSLVIQAVRDLFTRDSSGILTAAALIAFYTLSSGFAAVIRALDLIHGVAERRSWLHIRLTAFVLAIGSIVMLAVILVAWVVGPLLGSGLRIAERIDLGDAFPFFWDWMRPPLALALIAFWLTTLYHLAPYRGRGRSWLGELPGGLLASVLLLAVSYGFSFYLGLAAAGNQVLGVLGGGLILMVWFYLMSLVLLLGGELNAILAARRRP